MKTIFDPATRTALIIRINSLNENSIAQWGKMNLYQMLHHCARFEEMILGRKRYKQAFIGWIFGKIALKSFMTEDNIKPNMPTVPGFRVKENSGDISAARQQWISLIEDYENFSEYAFVHPFFGKMTKEQMGYLAYKHTDHHLRQFNG